MDEMAQKQRTEKMEQELADTQEYVKSFDKTLEDRLGELGSKLDNIATRSQRIPKEEKIEDIISKMKDKVPVRITKEVDEIDCPGCSKDGHRHALKKTPSGSLKCTGDHCLAEYLLAPKDSDAYCADCGFPIDSKLHDDACPNCKGTKGTMRKK